MQDGRNISVHHRRRTCPGRGTEIGSITPRREQERGGKQYELVFIANIPSLKNMRPRTGNPAPPVCVHWTANHTYTSRRDFYSCWALGRNRKECSRRVERLSKAPVVGIAVVHGLDRERGQHSNPHRGDEPQTTKCIWWASVVYKYPVR